LSGIFGFETSPSFESVLRHPLLQHPLLQRRNNYYYLGVFGLAAALIFSLVLNGSTHASADSPIVPAPQIGTALVIDRASDGFGNNPLVLANGKPLFPLNDSGFLSYDEGAPFAAVNVKVEALGNEVGFWVGTDDTERVFIHVTPNPTTNKLLIGLIAPQTLQVGQAVSVTGHFEAVPGDGASFGVKGDALAQLNNQTEYVEADSLKLY
jgi:hypothetical protein